MTDSSRRGDSLNFGFIAPDIQILARPIEPFALTAILGTAG
jgi:hypothetical protein